MTRARRRLRRHDRPRGAGRLARRDAPAPHRRARDGQRPRAAHGRHRLVSPVASRRRSSRSALEGSLEANVPARTLQELGRIAGGSRRGDDRRGRAREPGRLHRRRRGAVLAPGRRSLPELPAAAAGVLRARAAREPRRAARGRAAGRPAGAEERAAAPALLGGHARRLGADAGRRRGERVAAGAVRRRTARDRLQPGVLPRRARERRVRRADPEADQPAAARA